MSDVQLFYGWLPLSHNTLQNTGDQRETEVTISTFEEKLRSLREEFRIQNGES